MKPKSINALVAELKRYNAAYACLQRKRERTPHGPGVPPNECHARMNKEANRLCGNIMTTERKIINALLMADSARATAGVRVRGMRVEPPKGADSPRHDATDNKEIRNP